MFCGVKLECQISDFHQWKQKTGLDFVIKIGVECGEQKGTHFSNHTTYSYSAKHKRYKITVKEVHRGDDTKPIYWLIVEGSLHESYFGGENHSRFFHSDICQEVRALCNKLALKPDQLVLRNCEIGVNIHFPFPAQQYALNAILLHKTKPFIPFEENRKGICLGVCCKLSEYWIKIYAKSLQFALPGELMRVEIKFKKMRTLNENYELRTLGDLLCSIKIKKLIKLLCTTWSNLLIYEPCLDIDKLSLTKLQRELLLQAGNRSYWLELKNMNNGQFHKRRALFRSLMKKHGSNSQTAMLCSIREEWELLLQS